MHNKEWVRRYDRATPALEAVRQPACSASSIVHTTSGDYAGVTYAFASERKAFVARELSSTVVVCVRILGVRILDKIQVGRNALCAVADARRTDAVSARISALHICPMLVSLSGRTLRR